MTWKTIKGELETSTEKKNWNVGGPCQNTLRSLVVGVVFVTHEKRELFFLPFFSIWNSLRGYWMGVRPSKKKRKKKVSSSFISVLFTWPFCVCLRVLFLFRFAGRTQVSPLSLCWLVSVPNVYMYIALCGDGRWWDGPNKSVESPARWICHTAHGKIIQDTFWSNVGGGLYHSAGAYVHTYFSTKKQAPFISLFFSFLLSPLTLTSKGYIYIYI